MEFTRLNTCADGRSPDEAWHLVIAPRGRAEEQQVGEFSSDLPRAHFLRRGNAENASCLHSHDLQFESGWLHDCPSGSGCMAHSHSPHPLAQPGFYSPKIPRSKYCEPALSPTWRWSMRRAKECDSHTLPLRGSKTALLKQSELSCKPQGIKTSTVEKPRSMKASISRIAPDLNPVSQQRYEAEFPCIQDQTNQSQGFSSVHQRSAKLRRPEISKKEAFLLNHQSSLQSRSKHSTELPVSMPKCAPELPEASNLMLPQRQSEQDEDLMRLSLQSSGYCKLSLYSSSSECNQLYHSTEDEEESDAGNNASIQCNKSSKVTSVNVFGQPRVVATLRPACTPTTARRSTVVEDLKKLIVMDDMSEKSQRDSLSHEPQQPNQSPGDRLQGSASANLLTFHDPVLSRLPLLRPIHLPLLSDPTVCQLSETEGLEKDLETSHNPPPLRNMEYEERTAAHLLPAQRPHLVMSPGPYSPAYSASNLPHAESDTGVLLDLPDHLSHLEAMLRRLSSDLLKEKKDKVALLAEVLNLRVSNQHLKEESLTANAQLHNICQLFNISPECTE